MSAPESTFRVEYAKSARSKCRSCSSVIDKDTFRFAILVYSSKLGAKVPTWYHTDCFFQKVRLIDVKIIKGFDDLRWEDQDKIRHIIEENATVPADDQSPNDSFTVQYAKSNRSACRGCDLLIDKGTLRLSKKNYTSRRARRYGPTDDWYHVDCFHQIKNDLGFSGLAESFAGFTDLNKEEQLTLEEKFGSSTSSNPRKRKHRETKNAATHAKQAKMDEENEETRLRKEQCDLLWSYKDALRNDIPQDVLKELLVFNAQKAAVGEANLIEAVADCMAFGALEPCPECGDCLTFNSVNYRCTGNITEWTNCSYETAVPERKAFEIPQEIRDQYQLFGEYNYTKRDRIITQSIKKPLLINTIGDIQEPDYDPKLPLNNYAIAFVGRLSKRPRAIIKQIQELGGTVKTTIDQTVDVLISTQDEVQKAKKKVRNAQTYDIHVVSEQFLDDVLTDRPTNVMEKLKISSWGSLPHIRRQQIHARRKIRRRSPTTSRSSSRSKRSLPDKVTMKVKDGAAVDPDSGLGETCHVLKDSQNGGLFTAVLGMVDIMRGTNSYYKIQLLEADAGNQWSFFMSTGRTGTTFGSKKIDQFDDQSDAIDTFQDVFYEKTGNKWIDRAECKKLPKNYYPLEVDYRHHDDDNQAPETLHNSGGKSRLLPSVQDLIRLIFNVETMKQTLAAFDIDLTKMPLGKLSTSQLKKAYQILTELQTLLTDGSPTSTSIIDASNRFYTLIPHDFGLRKPKLLDNIDLIQSKAQMIDDLLEIEIAYSMLKATFDDEGEDRLDVHYKKLKCSVEPIDPSSHEYEQIEQYMSNTHAATHKQYTLKLKDLFRIQRENEDDRFQKWAKAENRQLLWHGSRTTNFAGILGHGLRIAPPKHPRSTGYMFGKGVYFADMVSKSANYCYATRDASEGLLLLCEVALGNMHECYKATPLSADTLPAGKQSTKGCGQTMPDPKEQAHTDDGMLIPMGHGVNADIPQSALLYNEYIVYDTDQVKIKYLLRVGFDYND